MSTERPSERLPGIRPGTTPLRRIDAAGRRSFPCVLTLAAVVLLAFPLGLPGDPELQQVLALASVYFWSVHRPASMPPWAAFLTGLLCDLLGPAPLGIAMLTLVIVNGVATRARIVLLRRGALVVWLAFVGLATASFALQWLLTCTLELRLVPPTPALFELALAAGLYPLLAIGLARLSAGIAAPERA
jgi:rod shape-determining protein MreD